MMDHVRRRNTLDLKGDEYVNKFDDCNKDFGDSPAKYKGLTLWNCLLVVVFHLAAVVLAIVAHHYVPETNINSNRADFAEWRARKHLEEITSYGVRPTGSFANEHKTVEYLLNTLRSFQDSKREDVVLDIDLQRPSGHFTIDFLEGFTSYYRNVSNVVARVGSRGSHHTTHSILINAHFDSSFGSPSASDDAVSCATMLEVIRCLTESNAHVELNHSLVFLFNGAEENFLQASHGFITQHPWAKDIRVFVNLEAAGAGGRELVFQTGPEHPWLIKTYANSSNYPFASILGQEIFQTGLIPADTDFRIFRDFGNIPGIDIAYISNGYVYHTARDLPQFINPGSIQRAGENLLGMLVQLTQSPLVNDPSDDQHGAMVFYDVLGLYLVHYPQKIGWILNTIVAAIAFVCIVLKFSKRTRFQQAVLYSKACLNMTSFIEALFCIIVSWALSLFFVFLLAKIITACGQSLSWYCKPFILIGLYALPGMLVMCAVHYWQATHFKSTNSWEARWNEEAHVFYATLFLWNTLLSIFNYHDFGSAYLFMLMVAFPLLGRVLVWELCINSQNRWPSCPSNPGSFVLMYLLSTAIPLVLWTYILWIHLEFLVPIFGRSGGNDPPDVITAIFVAIFVLVTLSYSISLVHVISSVRYLVVPLIVVWLVTTILVLTGTVFPYSRKPWCPKRIVFQHISRTFHDRYGKVVQKDSGLWVAPFDYLGIKYIDHLSEFKEAKRPDMKKGMFGDFPYYVPVAFMFDKTWYIPGPAPVVSTLSNLKLLSKEKIRKDDLVKLKFEINGPSHMSLYLSPRQNVEFIDSSLGTLYQRSTFQKTVDHERSQYFVYYSHGVYTGPWYFWIKLKTYGDMVDVVDVAISGHYSHGKDSRTPFLTHFIDRLPNWVNPTPWVSTYQKWTF